MLVVESVGLSRTLFCDKAILHRTEPFDVDGCDGFIQDLAEEGGSSVGNVGMFIGVGADVFADLDKSSLGHCVGVGADIGKGMLFEASAFSIIIVSFPGARVACERSIGGRGKVEGVG